VQQQLFLQDLSGKHGDKVMMISVQYYHHTHINEAKWLEYLLITVRNYKTKLSLIININLLSTILTHSTRINMADLTHQFTCLNYSLQEHDSSNIFKYGIFAGFAVRHTSIFISFHICDMHHIHNAVRISKTCLQCSYGGSETWWWK
jgi:hypothetical protein